MADAPSTGSTRASKVIQAWREALYRAFTDPTELIVWLPPGEMTGEMYRFDLRVGGGYRTSLFYPASGRAHAARPRRKKTALRRAS